MSFQPSIYHGASLSLCLVATPEAKPRRRFDARGMNSHGPPSLFGPDVDRISNAFVLELDAEQCLLHRGNWLSFQSVVGGTRSRHKYRSAGGWATLRHPSRVWRSPWRRVRCAATEKRRNR